MSVGPSAIHIHHRDAVITAGLLHLLAEGCCDNSIARRLGIGVGTVKTHVKGVMHRLDATARARMRWWWRPNGD